MTNPLHAFTRIEQLRAAPVQGSFDLTHLQEIHRRIYHDVYSWAGELRTVPMKRGELVLTTPQDIPAVADRLFAQIEREHDLRGLGRERFIERSAEVFRDLGALHAFRHGNERAAMVFMQQLAEQAGYELDWSRVPGRCWRSIGRNHTTASPLSR